MAPGMFYGTPLVIIALGIIALILSFMVTDDKKSKIALILAIVVILTGLFQFGSQSITKWQFDRRLKEIEKSRMADLEELRQRAKEKSAELAAPVVNKAPDSNKKP
ncbi:MAG: hypothetical protein ACKVQC_08500 [Elusimicrobiota bacterium]